jgi:hypothetical protein
VTAARAIANRTADLRGRTCAAPRTAADADPVDLRCRDSRAHADVSDCPIISIRSVIFVLDDPRHTPGTEKTARIAENAQADVLSRYYQQVPLLLFCFLTPRREQTARHALAAFERVITSGRTVKPRSNDQEPDRHSLAIRL